MGFNILAQVLFLVSLKAQKPFTAEARSTLRKENSYTRIQNSAISVSLW